MNTILLGMNWHYWEKHNLTYCNSVIISVAILLYKNKFVYLGLIIKLWSHSDHVKENVQTSQMMAGGHSLLSFCNTGRGAYAINLETFDLNYSVPVIPLALPTLQIGSRMAVLR